MAGNDILKKQRPQNWSVTLFRRPGNANRLGLGLRRSTTGRVFVVGLSGDDPTSWHALASVSIGDEVTRINGALLRTLSHCDVSQLLDPQTKNGRQNGRLVLMGVCHYGNPHAVHALIERPFRDALVGLQSSCNNHEYPEILDLADKGLVTDSVLRIGDRVRSVNGIRCKISEQNLAALLDSSGRYIAIMAERVDTEDGSALIKVGTSEASSHAGRQVENETKGTICLRQRCTCLYRFVLSHSRATAKLSEAARSSLLSGFSLDVNKSYTSIMRKEALISSRYRQF
ncbi:peptidase [Phaeodactylum tricornutum CCAP 1055/1]|jgi:hypothetical protein|uniref:Peptidase n=1 Tax=Phaeodactylum tricornutum (strain CCAP 1055/1) TaxID=556484 RepID=B7GBS6_PHATC|nr:peptidase [Phaeodactylum tricornutum CCAP 1055/1]EEC43899.1 peptidase [Phaeodactylum tricornutum CCAP 1055/1]|eukprot:XP_002184500.1 peptidase [Phaeodactylum tricornutum CCAP 1055/1]